MIKNIFSQRDEEDDEIRAPAKGRWIYLSIYLPLAVHKTMMTKERKAKRR